MQMWCSLAAIGAGMLLGCTATTSRVAAARPGWMENPQEIYPFNRYFTAVGEGDTLQAAETVALGNIAKIFRSEVTVDERLSERYYELIGKKNEYQEQSQLDRDTTVRTGMLLLNVQYPERYTDTKTGRTYALAALNRAETAGIYVTRLSENNTLTERFVARSEEASPALKFAVLSAAVAVSADSQRLLELLDVLLPAVKKQVAVSFTHDDLTQRLADAAKAIGFTVEIEDDPQGKIAKAISSMLTELGFTMSPDNAFLKMKGTIGMDGTDLGQQGLSFVRYRMQLELRDASGNVVAALSEHGREGHLSDTEAMNRSIRSMESVIRRELLRKLFVYFDGLAIQ